MTDEVKSLLERIQAARSNIERIDDVPALGTVFMQGINGETRQILLDVQQDLKAKGRKFIPPAVVIAIALCTEAGELAFDDFEVAIKAIVKMKSSTLSVLFENALRVTGLEAIAVELAEKKSRSSQSSESGTN